MSNNKIIELTPQELEDIKDDVKFKTMVAISLKELRGIPKKVWGLSLQVGFQWALLTAIFIGVTIKVIAG